MIADILNGNSDDSSSDSGGEDYNQYFQEHGVDYSEYTAQDEGVQQEGVMSSLAVVSSDSEETTDDSSDTSDSDIFDQNILKEKKSW